MRRIGVLTPCRSMLYKGNLKRLWQLLLNFEDDCNNLIETPPPPLYHELKTCTAIA